jgi:hypothetical protein
MVQYLLFALANVSTTIGGSARSNFTAPNDDTKQTDAFNTFKNEIPLGVHPATIFEQYACSVPKIKNTPSLLVSILVGATWF